MTASRSEFVPIRGLRYHVRRWGDPSAPALWLLHGWLDVSASFDAMAAPLLDDFQVLAPDWRGLGLTQWSSEGYNFHDYIADLDALLDHYEPGGAPLRLIGHSLGGQVASLYAGLRPRRVQRLALLDALMTRGVAPAEQVEYRRRWLDELKQPLREQSYESFEQLAVRIRRLHVRVTPERALSIARGWGRVLDDGRVGLRADPRHRQMFAVPYRPEESKVIWREVTAPTLFVDGALSDLRQWLPPQEVAERRACFRDRREVMLPDAGHMLHFEAPEATARELRPFFLPR